MTYWQRVLPALVVVLSGAGSVPLAAEGSRWTLATADTRMVIAVADDRPLIRSLRCVAQRHDWAGHGLVVPLLARVRVGTNEMPTHWRFAGGEPSRASGTLALRFTNDVPALELRSNWRAAPGHGPVEHWMEILNRSGEQITVVQVDSLALAGLEVGLGARLWWVRRGGSNASTQGGTFVEDLSSNLNLSLTSDCEDGASPVPWLAVQVGEKRGLYIGWEFSGLGRIQARGQDGGATLQLQVGNLPDFQTEVEPGETLLVPPAFVGCYAGDLDDGSYTLHQWLLAHVRPPLAGQVPDPLLAYNLYLDAGGTNATEATVLRSAQFCGDLGFEVFMPDAMWFPETGDWRWDPSRFPSGATPIEEYVHGRGLRFALWCAWSNGGLSEHPEALSVRGASGHPDWFNSSFPPDWQPGPFYGGRLCLGSEPAKEWAVQKTQWLVGHHRLDYLKHDIGPIVTHCDQTTHRHHHGVDVSYWATLGYYEVQDKLRQAFPQLVLEDCSGGGHIKDFGVLRRAHYIVTTDTLSNLPNRQSLYDSTFALPPLVLQAYTYDNYYPVKGDEPEPFLWRSAMMGAWQIDPTDTSHWTEAQRASAKRAVVIYKDWIRPMLRDLKVHHLLPRPDGVHWDGLFYWSQPRKRGTLYLFRPDAPTDWKTVKLKGLDPGRKYWVWSEDGSVAPGQHRGRELMGTGITARLPQRYSSDLIYIQDAALGRPKAAEAGSGRASRVLPPVASSTGAGGAGLP